MPRVTKKLSKQSGQIPGTLVHIGETRIDKVKVTVIDYSEEKYQEKQIDKIESCCSFKDTPTVTWINIDGVHDLELIEKIGRCFDLHPLVSEDIVNTAQRPKMEDYGNYLFMVLKMLYTEPGTEEITVEQVSLVLGKNYVISFQEKEGDIFNAIRERIRNSKGRIRKLSADYLAYALIDTVIDHYFLIIEKLGEKIEGMEEVLVINPTPQTLQSIHKLKRDTIFLRKSVWPLRELISGIERSESELIHDSTDIYLRDVYDHTIQVIDTIETFRDMIAGILDIYLSSVSNKMNEIMKVLTIIATIFIPLTFIVGIYGMNFNPGISRWNMPELNWRYGYLFAWGLMVLTAFIMVRYFKRKKWL